MTSLNYTTHSVDSIVKSCLDISDPHLHFFNEPYDEKINGVSYKVFQATINFLPHELTNFRCFNCGFTTFYRNGYTPKRLIRIPAVNATHQTTIQARSARIRCRNCNSTISAKTTLLPPNCQISYSLRAKIATKLRHDISAKTIAYEEGVSASTVNRMLSHTRSEIRNNFNFLPLHLCFDEFRGTHNSYHFICLDSDNHVIQTILPNRFKDTIIKYFMKFPESVRQLVRTVSCDLNSYYVDIAKTLLPNAKIIIDRFHIVQMLNRALNSMRTDLMNNFEHSSKNYKLFKRNWKLFLKRYDDLDCTHQFYERSLKIWTTSERLVNSGLEVGDQAFNEAYWDYQRLLEIIVAPTKNKIDIFKQRINEVHQKYLIKRTLATKSEKVLLSFFDNLDAIISALNPMYSRYTNGPLEGINRKIKQIQRTAYGYRNFDHLKARIYLQTYLGKDTRSSMKIA